MRKSDAQQIADGEFYTESELRAVPSRRRARVITTGEQRDPNTRPVTAAELARQAAMVAVCAYCYEPGDERSALGTTDGMHDECREVLAAKRAARA